MRARLAHPHRRAALALRIAAVGSAVITYRMVCEQEWLLAVALLWGAVVLTLMGGCFQGLYFADRARHEQARRAASGPSNELPMPCCQFWINSDGEVHGPGCTRPVLPRRDTYRLHPAERAAFEEITARYDDRSSA